MSKKTSATNATSKVKVLVNSMTYDHTKQPREKSDNPGLTKPNMALTIPEILKRYTSGRPINIPVYDDYDGDRDDIAGIDIRTLDISEIHDLLEVTRSNINALKVESDRRRKAKQDAELEASIIAKHEARLKEKRLAEEQQQPLKFKQIELPIKDQPES